MEKEAKSSGLIIATWGDKDHPQNSTAPPQTLSSTRSSTSVPSAGWHDRNLPGRLSPLITPREGTVSGLSPLCPPGPAQAPSLLISAGS